MESTKLTTEDRIIFARGSQSTVNISAQNSKHRIAMGSGFIIDVKNGIIGTNKHVVTDTNGAKMSNVKLQFTGIKEEIEAKISYASDKYDLAVLTFNPRELDNEAILVRDVILSDEHVSISQKVYLVGNSLGLGSKEGTKRIPNAIHTLSGAIGVVKEVGIRYSFGANISFSEKITNNEFVEVDVLMYGGNSGGLVSNENGHLIGVPTLADYQTSYKDNQKFHRLVDDEGKLLRDAKMMDNGSIQGNKRKNRGGIFYTPMIAEPSAEYIPARYLIETLEEAKATGLTINYKTSKMLRESDPDNKFLLEEDKLKSHAQRMIDDSTALQRQRDAKAIYRVQTEEFGMKPASTLTEIQQTTLKASKTIK